jgi:hypothetical protein
VGATFVHFFEFVLHLVAWVSRQDAKGPPRSPRKHEGYAKRGGRFGWAGDVARCCIGCVRLRGGPLGPFCILSDFKGRGMGSFLHPAVTVARWRWQFGWSEGAGRLFSMRVAGVEMRHRSHGATANTVPRPAAPPAVVVP